MAGLVRQEERVVARERALRHAGLALVGATGLEEIYAATIEAVQSLVGRAVAVWVVDVQEDGFHIVASSDGPRAEPARLDVLATAWVARRAASGSAPAQRSASRAPKPPWASPTTPSRPTTGSCSHRSRAAAMRTGTSWRPSTRMTSPC